MTEIVTTWAALRAAELQRDKAQPKRLNTPPKSAKFLLLLVPKRNRENLIGDLEEEFNTLLVPQYGLRLARLWYCWHVLLTLAPVAWENLKRVAGLTALWKLLR
jgi:hypothetical protein